LDEQNLKDKFEQSDRDTITSKVKEVEEWAHGHPDADTP